MAAAATAHTTIAKLRGSSAIIFQVNVTTQKLKPHGEKFKVYQHEHHPSIKEHHMHLITS
jgi:hypothetical protein